MRRTLIKAGKIAFTIALTIAAFNTYNVNAASADYDQYDLVWSDEFDGTSLNNKNWKYETGTGANGWGNNEIQYYTNFSSNVFISNISSDTTSNSADNKALAIKVFRNGSRLTSGRIITKDLQSFKYGRIEARLKVENGNTNAIWPAFWMLGQNYSSVGWPKCGEIDIMEHANTRSYVGGAVHWYQNGAIYRSGNGLFAQGDGGSIETWHTYAIEWDETGIKWYLDNYCYKTFPYENVNVSSICQKDFFIILNVAVGGRNTDYTGKVALPSTFKDATMYVDYVRVYQNAAQKRAGASFKGSWTPSTIFNKHYLTFKNGSTTVLEKTFIDNTVFPAISLAHVTKQGYTLSWKTAAGAAFDVNGKIPHSLPMKETINAVWTKVTPKKATIKLKRLKKKRVKVTLKSTDNAKGFQIKYGRNRKITKKVKKRNLTKKTIKLKLKSKRIYYFKVREYKLDSTNSKVYGAWSKAKKIKVK